MRGASASQGVVWGDLERCTRGNIAVQRENRREGGEEHCIAGDVEEKREMDQLMQGPAHQ